MVTDTLEKTGATFTTLSKKRRKPAVERARGYRTGKTNI